MLQINECVCDFFFLLLLSSAHMHTTTVIHIVKFQRAKKGAFAIKSNSLQRKQVNSQQNKKKNKVAANKIQDAK